MSARLGSVAHDSEPRTSPTGPGLPLPARDQGFVEEAAAAIDEEVRSIVQKAMASACKFYTVDVTT
jgi:ATP-dependent Zn protease